jgi:hypothetical protein
MSAIGMIPLFPPLLSSIPPPRIPFSPVRDYVYDCMNGYDYVRCPISPHIHTLHTPHACAHTYTHTSLFHIFRVFSTVHCVLMVYLIHHLCACVFIVITLCCVIEQSEHAWIHIAVEVVVVYSLRCRKIEKREKAQYFCNLSTLLFICVWQILAEQS